MGWALWNQSTYQVALRENVCRACAHVGEEHEDDHEDGHGVVVFVVSMMARHGLLASS